MNPTQLIFDEGGLTPILLQLSRGLQELANAKSQGWGRIRGVEVPCLESSFLNV